MLASQTAGLLAGELDERSRLPVVVIDEAHLLANTDLESLRMLTNTDMDAGSHFAMLLVGQPTLRRRLKLAVLAALDQRISTRYTITGMGLADTSATASWKNTAVAINSRIASASGVNMNRRGVVFVPAVGDAQLDRLVDLVATTSLEVYYALLDER